MSVEPYSFEPKRKENKKSKNKRRQEDQESSDEWVDIGSDEEVFLPEDDPALAIIKRADRSKVPAETWCKCGSCKTMPVGKECLCCVEIEEIEKKKLSDEVTCILQHEGFEPVVLNKYVLWAALVNLNDRECAWLPPEDNVPNRSYRYTAYRQCTYFIHAKLGRYVRRILPACAMIKIRETFPEPDGQYTLFDGDDEGANLVSEVDFAWQYME